MKLVLLIAAAGAAGSALRYLTTRGMQCLPFLPAPWHLLTVNLTGCLAAGAVLALAESRWERFADYAPVIMIGFLGAFTTFSAYAVENLLYIERGESGKALLSIGLHTFLGLGAVWIGLHFVKYVLKQVGI